MSDSHDPMGYNLPCSSVHGTSQTRTLEWVAISFFRGTSQPRDQTRVSHIVGRRFTVWATREAILSSWCYLTILFSATLFLHLQCFPASESFPVNWPFTSGGQSIGASTSGSVLPMTTRGWFPLGLTGLIFLQSIGLSQESSPAPQFESVDSSPLSLL